VLVGGSHCARDLGLGWVVLTEKEHNAVRGRGRGRERGLWRVRWAGCQINRAPFQTAAQPPICDTQPCTDTGTLPCRPPHPPPPPHTHTPSPASPLTRDVGRPWLRPLEQVGVVAALAQLHDHVEQAGAVRATIQRSNVLLQQGGVPLALHLAHADLEDGLLLGRQPALHVALDAAQQEGAQHLRGVGCGVWCVGEGEGGREGTETRGGGVPGGGGRVVSVGAGLEGAAQGGCWTDCKGELAVVG
jgi:hypothetical protein